MNTKPENIPAPLPLTKTILIDCGASKNHAGIYLDLLNELLPYYSVNTYRRVSHLMGQLLHESNRFRAVEEYATGAAYEFRKDLGNFSKGDGVKFKGRGLIQVTGKFNYEAFKRRYGVDVIANPELLTQPRWAVASALWYWGTRGLNLVADRNDCLAISQIINMGSVPRKNAIRQTPNGYADRLSLTNKSKIALSGLFDINGELISKCKK